MAKHSKSCAVQTIRFKTSRGRVVSFRGRPGGDSKADGKCAHKARKFAPEAKRAQRQIAAAGRKCAKQGRPGSAGNKACLRKFFGKGGGAHQLRGY